ncbi:MAG: NADH-quinone oxidoreductase subunit NuoK [Epsilonproteobacteria bacterium]|nr:MAG: NADH-quinone oxidoreductase subunit NuoK [Campylobacterota bacterium]RLA65733.1 MAG: NADH-quinone oxidoreductase subunit NuoK [Campylobacterota bacterium]
MMGLASYLIISTILFICGVIAILARKNIIAILLGLELILNASALNFVAYTRFLNNSIDGHIFSLFIIVIAAAEAAVALAIVLRFYQIRETVHIDDATQLQG